MASKCPKCHELVADDVVCCADVKYTWKCKACGKLTTGFVVPYGRCYLCGGENQVVEGYHGDNPAKVTVVQEAMQFELDAYHFYRMATARTSDPQMRIVLEEMYKKEEDHLGELESKYHVHLSPELKKIPPKAETLLSNFVFAGIDFEARAAALPAGPESEIYRELAAEEEDHVAILETERAQFEGA
jgi:hypothetical protein